MKRRSATPQWQRNLAVAAFAEILILISSQASFNLIPYYVQQLGITDPLHVTTYTATYQSIGLVTFAIFTPIWGILSDRYGRKPMFVRAIAATFLTCVMIAMARTPTHLLVARVIQGCLTPDTTRLESVESCSLRPLLTVTEV